MIEKYLFSKSNISTIFKVVLTKTNLNDTTKDKKKKIMEILLNNMKNISQEIEESKVNKKNLNIVLDQFNNLSINQTINILYNKDKSPISNNIQISQVKFNRDNDINSKKK